MVLEFTFNTTTFGFGSMSNCTRDYMEFYNGMEVGGTAAMKVCGNEVPLPFTLSMIQARVVFKGSSMPHMQDQVGAKVSYTTIEQGNIFCSWKYTFLCCLALIT